MSNGEDQQRITRSRVAAMQEMQDLQERQTRLEETLAQITSSLATLTTQITASNVSHASSSPVAADNASAASARSSGAKPPTPPKKKMTRWEGNPNDRPEDFKAYMDKMLDYARHYALSKEDAVSELKNHADDEILRDRLECCVEGFPGEFFEQICKRLTEIAQPAAVTQQHRFREIRNLCQAEGESGESFARRFESTSAAYRRAMRQDGSASSSESVSAELVRQLRAALNTSYLYAMREMLAPGGSLSRIDKSFVALQETLREVRTISSQRRSQGIVEKSLEELSPAPQTSSRPVRVPIQLLTSNGTSATTNHTSSGNSESTRWRCRTCQSNDHDWKTCDRALARSFCRVCRKKCHPTFLHNRVTKAQQHGDTTIPVAVAEVTEAMSQGEDMAANPAAENDE